VRRQTEFSIVCLAQAIWEAPLPTNRQQIMRRAAQHGHHVLFVNTGPFLGRRVADALRGRKVRASLRESFHPVDRGGRVQTLTAFNVLPWGSRFRICNRINAWLTAIAIRRAARRLPKPVVLWIYDPNAASLIGRCGESLVAYDCVDDFAALSFYSRRERALARQNDSRAAASADIVFATTSTLYDRHRRVNPNTHRVGNVGDYAHFESALDRGEGHPRLQALPRPVFGFAGNIVPGKVDVDLVERIAAGLDGASLVLAGPVDPSLATRIEALASRPNVVSLGRVPYEELPSVVSFFDVALIPYVENDYTRSCFPLKTFEYLAAGKPVVASGLPELAGMEPDVVVAADLAGFRSAIDAALELQDDDDLDRRQALARKHTWETRAQTLLGLVSERLHTP
jgi:glycosyltransferase involved in cell wall biosynthesis